MVHLLVFRSDAYNDSTTHHHHGRPLCLFNPASWRTRSPGSRSSVGRQSVRIQSGVRIERVCHHPAPGSDRWFARIRVNQCVFNIKGSEADHPMKSIEHFQERLAQAEAFRKKRGRPFITISYAQSVNGSIALNTSLQNRYYASMQRGPLSCHLIEKRGDVH